MYYSSFEFRTQFVKLIIQNITAPGGKKIDK